MIRTRNFIVPVALLLLSATTACSDSSAPENGESVGTQPATGRPKVDAPPEMEEQPISETRERLLETAFLAVSKFPDNPHAKNRARAREEVVEACLELGRPERARRYAETIHGWRRGVAHARIAEYAARRGWKEAAERHLEAAEAFAWPDPEDPETQEWRGARVRAFMARAHLQLGEMEQARDLAAGLVDSEANAVLEAQVELESAEASEQRLARIDDAMPTANLDGYRGLLAALTALHDRHYADEELRGAIVERIGERFESVPGDLRIGAWLDMARTALANEDAETADSYLAQANDLFRSVTWRPEHDAPLRARIAAVTGRLGDMDRAEAELLRAADVIEEAGRKIYDMFRARAWRPIAEAWQELGREEKALEIYAIALRDGALNPNARPRAVDLSRTLLSMARHGVEPTDEIWGRITTIDEGLENPW